MSRSEYIWKKNKKMIITILGITAVTAGSFVAGAWMKDRALEQQEQRRIEEKAEEERQKEQEKISKIEENLCNSPYEAELRTLYEEYPQMEEMLLQLEFYSDELVEYLIKVPDAVDWVIAYPKYSAMTDEERSKMALEPLEMDKYEMHGQVPIFYQWDMTWGYAGYGNGYMAMTGCAPTCLSMAAVALTGDTGITPKMVANVSESMEAYIDDVGTSWELMTEGARALGIKSQKIETWSVKAIRSALAEGEIVICSMGEGDFTTQGHFILIVGETEDGLFVVNDPNSKSNTHKAWDGKDMLDQMKGMWALSI